MNLLFILFEGLCKSPCMTNLFIGGELMAREVFDLYTPERVKSGQTMLRGDKVPDGLYRLVVHICIFNSRGQMLVQQRQPFKHGWSNLWDLSVGGCVVSGEDSRAGAARETREELGLDMDFSQAAPSFTLYWASGFDDFYLLTVDVDLSALRLQYEEVQAVKWASKEEILAMIDDGSFIPYEKSLIEFLFFRRDHTECTTRDDISKA